MSRRAGLPHDDAFDHAWIAAHIPHHGSMCLLDRVVEPTMRSGCAASPAAIVLPTIRCARHGRLAAACGIEYAAQAMAVHGALLADGGWQPRPGFLASVRGAVLHVGRLDDIAQDLDVEAVRVTGDSGTVLYDFTIARRRPAAGGRARRHRARRRDA